MGCCFEVDKDVKDLFINEFSDIEINNYITKGEIIDDKQKFYIDTISINKDVLIKMGLKENNIISSDICSKCNSSFVHSHRHEGINSGRNIALICLK